MSVQNGSDDDAKISAERAVTLTSGGSAPGVEWRAHALLARLGRVIPRRQHVTSSRVSWTIRGRRR